LLDVVARLFQRGVIPGRTRKNSWCLVFRYEPPAEHVDAAFRDRRPLHRRHERDAPYSEDLGERSLNAAAKRLLGQKAANVARHQDWRTVNNSLVLCTLANVPPETVVGLLNHACGLDWDVEAMLRCGERGWNLKRVINHRLGLTRANDRLPGPLLLAYEDDAEGFTVDFEAMLGAYYAARDWDPFTGAPSPVKLEQLGLGWASATS